MLNSSSQLRKILKSLNLAGIRAPDGTIVASYGGLVDGCEYTPVSSAPPPRQTFEVDSVTLRYDAFSFSDGGGATAAAAEARAAAAGRVTFRRLTESNLQRLLTTAGAAGVVPMAHGEDPLAALAAVGQPQGRDVIMSVKGLKSGGEYVVMPAVVGPASTLEEKARHPAP